MGSYNQRPISEAEPPQPSKIMFTRPASGGFAQLKSAGQYLSNRLISIKIEDHKGVKLGCTESTRSNVESAEHGVGAPVSVPDFHRGRLGSFDPVVQDSGVSNPSPGRCR